LATNPSVAQRFFRNDAHTALSPASFKMVWKSNGEPAKYEDVESISFCRDASAMPPSLICHRECRLRR
jgi:hypothetical protein